MSDSLNTGAELFGRGSSALAIRNRKFFASALNLLAVRHSTYMPLQLNICLCPASSLLAGLFFVQEEVADVVTGGAGPSGSGRGFD